MYPDTPDQLEGCVTLTEDFVDNHADTSCYNATRHCPNCYRLDTSANGITLQITNCQFLEGKALGDQALFLYTFYNTGLRPAFLNDGTREYFIRPMGKGDSATSCVCSGNGLMTCSADAPLVMKITDMNANTISTECNTITDVNPLTIDMATTQCNGNYCPRCFRLDTDTANTIIKVEIQNCQYYQGVDLGTNYVLKYEFINAGVTHEAHVTDGTKVYKLLYGTSGSSATQCTCYNGQLNCDAVTVEGQWAGPLHVTGYFSVFEYARVGKSLSVLDYTWPGSTPSTQSYL